MSQRSEREFTQFVTSRYASLVRSSYLLTGDRGHAEDVVQTALMRTYRHWRGLREVSAAESQTRVIMVRLAGRWSKRRWTGEVPSSVLPVGAFGDHPAVIAEATSIRSVLAALPRKQRAVLLLRYCTDYSEAKTAAALGCPTGTVNSRAARALAALRIAGHLSEAFPTVDEVPHA